MIDPGLHIEEARGFLLSRNLKLMAILLTQGGLSPVGRTASLAARFQAPVYLHARDLTLLHSLGARAQKANWCEIHTPQISRLLQDGDVLFEAPWTTTVRSLGKPTPGSVVYRISEFSFCGEAELNSEKVGLRFGSRLRLES